MRSPSATLAAATALALAVSGCGGPDLNLGSGGDLKVPDGSYEEVAGAICEQIGARFADAQRDEPRTFSQGAAVTANLLDIARDGEEALANIEPPGDVAAAYRRYLSSRGDVVAHLQRANAAAEDEDGAAYEDARREAESGAGKRAKLARQAGLPRCAAVEER